MSEHNLLQGCIIIKVKRKPYYPPMDVLFTLDDWGSNRHTLQIGNDYVINLCYFDGSLNPNSFCNDEFYVDRFHDIKLIWVDGEPEIIRGYMWKYEDEDIKIISTTKDALSRCGFNAEKWSSSLVLQERRYSGNFHKIG